MKRVLVKSVYSAFDYVMEHYYPEGLEANAERKDTYAVISIQDTHTGGFGFIFSESNFCKGVLTLYFDDIVKEVPGAVLFDDEMAEKIISFIIEHEELIAVATKYAAIRAGWQQLSREEKMDRDSSRTFCHNSVITHFNMLARYLKMQGKPAKWRDQLGYEEDDKYFRKTIGDFGCYLVFINSLCAREDVK